MTKAAEIRALLVTSDPWLVSNFTAACRELGIDAQSSAIDGEIPEELDQAKYEAVLVDFDTVPKTPAIMGGIRESRGNRTALVFAVAIKKAVMEPIAIAALDDALFIADGESVWRVDGKAPRLVLAEPIEALAVAKKGILAVSECGVFLSTDGARWAQVA